VTVAADLTVLSFTVGGDGALLAPVGSRVTLNPVGAQFYSLQITVGANSMVTVVVHKSAVKITRESKLPANNR